MEGHRIPCLRVELCKLDEKLEEERCRPLPDDLRLHELRQRKDLVRAEIFAVEWGPIP